MLWLEKPPAIIIPRPPRIERAMLPGIIPVFNRKAGPTTPFGLGSATTNSQAATLSFTVTAAVPAGALIVVGAEWGSNNAGTLGTVSDSASNSYAQIDQATMGNPANGCGLFYAKNVSALTTSQSITLNITTAVGTYGAGIIAVCFPGRNTSTPLDVHSVGTSTTPNSGNVTTGTASEMIAGFCTYYTSGALTEDGNFTNVATVTHTGGNSQKLNLAYRVVSSTGTFNYAPTGTTAQAGTFIATFK